MSDRNSRRSAPFSRNTPAHHAVHHLRCVIRAISHVTQRASQLLEAALTDEIPDAQAAPESAAIASSERSGLLAAVRCLPLVYRQPVILTLEDFSPAEIAAMLGLSANVVVMCFTDADDSLAAYHDADRASVALAIFASMRWGWLSITAARACEPGVSSSCGTSSRPAQGRDSPLADSCNLWKLKENMATGRSAIP